MESNKRLGRGLEQLFNNDSLYMDNIERDIVDSAKESDIVELELTELRSNPYQPRKSFDQEKINELANSIKEYGVIQPIIVTKSIKGYNIVAGERRAKAASMAGLTTIPAIIKEFNDDDMMMIALLENIQREDLNSIEEAEAYKNLLETLMITQEELAKKLGKSRVHITNMLGLLNLPDQVKQDVLNNLISMGHARVLSKLENKNRIIELSNKVKKDNLSVRDLEKLVKEGSFQKKNPINRVAKISPYGYIESTLKDLIGSNVKVTSKNIIIPFASEKDLERILEILRIDVKIDE